MICVQEDSFRGRRGSGKYQYCLQIRVTRTPIRNEFKFYYNNCGCFLIPFRHNIRATMIRRKDIFHVQFFTTIEYLLSVISLPNMRVSLLRRSQSNVTLCQNQSGILGEEVSLYSPKENPLHTAIQFAPYSLETNNHKNCVVILELNNRSHLSLLLRQMTWHRNLIMWNHDWV